MMTFQRSLILTALGGIAASACPGQPAAALVIDTAAPAGANTFTRIGTNNRDGDTAAAQSFTLPTGAGTQTLLDTFELSVLTSFNRNGQFGVELRGYLGVFDSSGTSLTIIGRDPVFQLAGDFDEEYERYQFSPRDSAGDRVALDASSLYAVVVTGDDPVFQFVDPDDFSAQIASSFVANDGGYSDGDAFTFQPDAAELGIEASVVVGAGIANSDLAALVTLVPEPASMLLLAAGGMFHLRRRA